MVPATCASTAPVPSPSYQRAVARQPTALHLTALTLVTTLRLLDLCRLAVRAGHRAQVSVPVHIVLVGAPRVGGARRDDARAQPGALVHTSELCTGHRRGAPSRYAARHVPLSQL